MRAPKAIRNQGEAGLGHKATISEKLDEALDESFPASDPVSLGRSDRVGQPKLKRNKGDSWPKGAVGMKGKR